MKMMPSALIVGSARDEHRLQHAGDQNGQHQRERSEAYRRASMVQHAFCSTSTLNGVSSRIRRLNHTDQWWM